GEQTEVEVVLYHSRYLGNFGIWQAVGYQYIEEPGGFRFENLPPGGFTLEVVHPASGRRGKRGGTLGSDGEELEYDITLEGRGTVTGTFFDGSQTTPIPNARIKIRSNALYPKIMETMSDSEGNFTFQQVGEGPYTLTSSDPATLFTGSAEGEVEYEGHEVVTDIYAKGSGIVKGMVYKADGTTPVPGAIVKLYRGYQNSTVYTAYTNQEGEGTVGEYTIDLIPEGNFSLKATEPAPGCDSGKASGSVEFHGQEAMVNIIFGGLGSVEGYIYDGSGDPVSDVPITITSGSYTRNTTSYGTGSPEPGKYRFDSVPMGEFSLGAKQLVSNLGGSGNGILISDEQVVAVNVTLDSAGSISGRIVAADGTTPAQNAYLTLIGTNCKKKCSTGATGTFQFEAVYLGDYVLNIQGSNSSGKGRVTGTLSSNGEAIALGDIILDDAAPTVSGITPENGSMAVPLTTALTLNFSEEMNASTINTTNIKLTSGSMVIPGSVVLSQDLRSAVFTPSAPLNSFTNYTLTVKTAVEDKMGNPLGAAVPVSFITVDVVPPAVSSVYPSNNLSGVLPETAVTVTFTEPVNPTLFGNGNLMVMSREGAVVPGNIVFPEGNRSLVFTPAAPWTTDTYYNVTVQGAVDLAGNIQTVVKNTVFFTKDTIVPTLEIESMNGTTVRENSAVQVNAVVTGTDALGDFDVYIIKYYIDGKFLRTSPFLNQTTTHLQFKVPTMNDSGSTFLFEAVAVDKAGNLSDRKSILFTLLKDEAPEVTIEYTGDTTVYPGDKVTVKVLITDDLWLQSYICRAKAGETVIYDYHKEITQRTNNSNHYVDIPVDTQPGTEIKVFAFARDDEGNTSSAVPLTLYIPEDEHAPQVTITSPTETARFKHLDVVTIAAGVTDDVYIKEVRFYVDGQLVDTQTKTRAETSYTCDYATPPVQAEKNVEVKVEAEDLTGKITLATAGVIFEKLVDLTAPQVAITAPTTGSLVFAGEELKIKVTATDDEAVAQVEVYVDNQLLQTLTETPYEALYTVPADAVIGTPLTIRAEATDVDGKTGSVASVVTVVEGDIIPADSVIGVDDATYENRTIIIREGTVTINGSHVFENVLVKESGILTHSGCTTTEVYKQELTLTGQLVVGPDAAVDVSDRGYLGGARSGDTTDTGRTFGNTKEGGSGKYNGGSYGGMGALYSRNWTISEVYGSPYEPEYPGSGGGGNTTIDKGGNGGGVIRIEAAAVIVDGAIKADGGDGAQRTGYYQQYSGGGSGGSLKRNTLTLSGSGTFTADGGDSDSRGAGGGGRIALYYEQARGFDLETNIRARGGICKYNYN
ncbi:MAG: hypothetical protein GY737_05710, partial [Desulfobacteraceae bacterium]|nr:hypothetical protein [Desulfobacteraceae bacterium]